MNTLQSTDNTGANPSRPLPLKVVKAETPHPSLPTPYITEASAGGLDLSTFAGDAHVAVAPWPLIAAGQRAWLQIAGTGADGASRTIELLTAYSLTASDAVAGLKQAVKRADLSGFADGSTITVECRVAFDQSADRSGAVVFRTVSYAIRHALPFYMDPSPVTLSVGATAKREATGGTMPYTYRSSDETVATVLASDGMVTARTSGEATITARDASQQTGEYRVVVMPNISEDLEDVPAQILGLNQSVTTRSGMMTFKLLAGFAQFGDIGEAYPPECEDMIIAIGDYPSRVSITFASLCYKISFGLANGDRIRGTVVVRDAQDEIIDTVMTPPYGLTDKLWFTHRSASRPIKSMIYESHGGFSYLDNFSLE